MDGLKRIVIVAKNEVGVIADITRVLADGGINLEGINTDSIGDQGTVIITADDTDHALALLNQAGFKAVSDETMVLRLKDEPGALAAVADCLKQANVNIQSMHILDREAGYATVGLTTDDRQRAEAAIRDATII